jgi:solute carrier family 12 sodium/potassium/chloride transporter 2
LTIFGFITRKKNTLAGQKKFGFFAGVFTPSILTILGVIMYMRLGWVVGHAGLTGSIIIILVAHVISVATGLSISSIATNKKVGAGGVYYVLSRSLGLPMGGAIGYTLFVATSFSIALYLIGFAENFNPVLGLGSSINDFRISGTVALLLLTLLVYISTSVAIKSQYFILAAIVLSLGAIFLGDFDLVSPVGTLSSPRSNVSFALLFGIFFPAVTGFTAGIAMSGDLENPKRDIPIGTMLSIGVGLIIYLVLAVFLSVNVEDNILQSNYNILMDVALFAPFVIAGIWGATLSSALGGLLGGPRIFQAMSVDNITPFSKVFAAGSGKLKEPRNALILTIIIAEIGVLVGELDAIARLVSMFYLMAYNFINLSFFLESWANSDFSPKFKVSKWVGAIGFVATFTVMFQIDPIAMVLAYLLLFGMYFFLKRNELSLNTGDIWGSVWSSVVKAGLRKMDGMDENQNYWRPNILLFSGGTEKRPHLIELSQDIGGRSGVISNFDLIESPNARVLFPKKDKGIKAADILEDGIFTRRQEVRDIYDGIETIASVYGFSGIEPNTVLMGWPRKTNQPEQFANLTQSLIDLDYNVLYMDYDEVRGYGKYETIDLWWRGISNNVILTIRLVKFILSSQRWTNAKVRVLLVNEDNVDRDQIQDSIIQVLNEFRLHAEIKIINNSTEKLSIFELMKHYSNVADLVFLGVPDKIYDPQNYVDKTNNLLDSIGTTLLVRASSQFSEISLGFIPKEKSHAIVADLPVSLTPLQLKFNVDLNSRFEYIENRLSHSNKQFTEVAISALVNMYVDVFQSYHTQFSVFFEEIDRRKSRQNFRSQYSKLNTNIQTVLDQSESHRIANGSELLEREIDKWTQRRSAVFNQEPRTITRVLTAMDIASNPNDLWDISIFKKQLRLSKMLFGKATIHIDWRDLWRFYESSVNLHTVKRMLHDLGMIEALNIKVLKDRTVVVIEQLLTDITREPENRTKLINEAKKYVLEGIDSQIEQIKSKPEQLLRTTNKRDREMILLGADLVKSLDVNSIVEDLEDDLDSSKEGADRKEIEEYTVFWKRNQKLFSNLFIAWTVTTGLHVELVFLKDNVATDMRVGIFGMFRRLSKHLNQLFVETDAVDASEKRLHNFDENELLAHNPSDFLAKIQEELRDNIRHLPETVELIQEDSILNFEDFQQSEVEQITVELQKIADYFIELDFIEPLNRRIDHTYHVITSRFEEMGSRVSFINDIAENPSPENQEQVRLLKEKLLIDLDELNHVINTTEIEFISMLDKQFAELTQKLSVSELQSTSASLSRFIHIKHSYQSIFQRAIAFKNTASNWFSSSVFELRRKQHQLRMAEFKDRNKTLVNKRRTFRNFVELNQIDEKVNAKLPTYYKHLFSGKQVFNKQLSINRDLELDQAFSSLGEGDTGAVLVISEPLGGKSHFVESLLQRIKPPKIYRIAPPKYGIDATSNLLETFQKATKIEGNYFKIMNSLPEGTTFVFSKLELWWLRKNGGGKHIDQLVWLIERYGAQHNFVLTMNNFAYDLVRQVTKLDSILSATIILPPVNSNELAELMYERHQLAGVQISWASKEDKILTKRELIKHFEKFCQAANGNIGVALISWLGSIEKFENETVVVRPFKSIKLPARLPGPWSVLLTHLVLHDRLHLNNIIDIFHLQDKTTVNGVIKELKYTKFIMEVSKNTFAVEPCVSKSIIEELKNLNYLKKFE